MVYKPVKTLSEQVDYLEKDKRVIYETVSKIDAEEILYTYSYINVITPFKHRFAKKYRKTGETVRNVTDGKHIYLRDVDFSEYYIAYRDERYDYPKIYCNLMRFETAFNSIISYELEQYYKLDTDKNMTLFFDDLMKNTYRYLNPDGTENKKVQYMRTAITNFPNILKEYNSIYIFFDRLMLNDLVTVFRCCPEKVRRTIFQSLLNRELTFGYRTCESFDIFLTKYIQIRNYVCHFSSLEILVNYKDFRNKTIRHKSQRDAYKKAIKKLSE